MNHIIPTLFDTNEGIPGLDDPPLGCLVVPSVPNNIPSHVSTAPPDYLALLNPNPRDDRITFQEEGHLYTIEGTIGHPISVTTIIHNFFPHFDADKVIEKMMSGKNWTQSPYYGKTANEIKTQWSDSGKDASNLGTLMHADVERYLNKVEPLNPDTREFGYFLSFWKDFATINPGWVPYRTEWTVYDEDKMLAGSIDCTLTNEAGEIVILDWKRSKEIKRSNRYEKGHPPFQDMENCNYYHYTLQLNIYRHVLETRYGKIVKAMYIAVFHPNNETYQAFMIERYDIASIWDRLFQQKKYNR